MADSIGKTILVTDDEPDVQAYLSTFFEDNGFNVLQASDGAECLKIAAEKQPDIITLDISMPNTTGVRAFRDLQDNDATKKIPVIMITGVTSEFKQFISTRKQVDPPIAYFEKPIDREQLLEKVKEILGI